MITAPLPDNEVERVKALKSYDILDTLSEKEFDDITRIASELCGTPISLVSLIDEKRQWFKSRVGLDATETPRDLAFCAHAILEPDEIMEIRDASKDERFHDNPLSTGAPDVIFYAGAPLINEDGMALGTLCVIDDHPRELSKEQKIALKSLSRQVVALLEIRKKNKELLKATLKLQEANETLEQFAYVASHDLKSPLNNIVALAQTLDQFYNEKLDDEGNEIIRMLKTSAQSSRKLVEEILNYAVITGSENIEMESVNIVEVINEVQENLIVPETFKINIVDKLPTILSNKTLLYQIFQNLISNAIRYNDKTEGWINIECRHDSINWNFKFADNGPGIPEEYWERIFQMFQSLKNKDRFGKKGTGIGLATVKKLVEKLDGEITLTSKLEEGTTFTIKLPRKES
jgi:hypothetical protein